MFRSDLFVGKVALVSGGGTGIGYCITNELATCGATVVIASGLYILFRERALSRRSLLR